MPFLYRDNRNYVVPARSWVSDMPKDSQTRGRRTGSYVRSVVAGETVNAYVPFSLPPAKPPLKLDDRLLHRLRLAEHALTRLDLAGDMVPSLDWFLYAFVRKEAVITSQIEGTQATLVDLF